MITKSESVGTKVDWNVVEKATEVPRTYLVKDNFGNEFYKMYKPSEAQKIFKSRGWTGTIVSTLDKSKAGKKS